MDNELAILAGQENIAKTLALLKTSLSKASTITIGTGLTAYDLQAPAKNIYPIITPLRNSIPREGRANPGDAVRWRTIASIVGSGFDSMGWVPEGQRTSSMSYTAISNTAPYVTMGEESVITFEAEAGATGFEDVNATATMRLLQKTMRKEEGGILGGNATLQLGTAATPTVANPSNTSSTLPSATYVVQVAYLTRDGFALSVAPTANGTGLIATTKSITGNDGQQYTLNGGCSNVSLQSLGQATTVSSTMLSATVPSYIGAFAYAWFVAVSGSTPSLQAITTINSATFSAALFTGTPLSTSITADYSANAGLAYDGFLTIAAKGANNALGLAPYYQALATGTAGTGTFLTPSGRGSVVEIDNMLVSMWNNYRLSPTVLYVNAQEQKNITSKCLTATSGPLLHINAAADTQQGFNYTANGNVRWYYNPYSVDGGFDIPIKVHPDMPPGTIMGFCEKLPPWYQDTQVDAPYKIQTRRDYYRIDWPLRTRAREFGTYLESVLVPYAPFASGIITNCGNG